MTITLREQDRAYRRGLILGLTMAEIVVLVIFALLLALTAAIAVREKEIAGLRFWNANQPEAEALFEKLRQLYPNSQDFDDLFVELTSDIYKAREQQSATAQLVTAQKEIEAARQLQEQLKGGEGGGASTAQIIQDANTGRAIREALTNGGLSQQDAAVVAERLARDPASAAPANSTAQTSRVSAAGTTSSQTNPATASLQSRQSAQVGQVPSISQSGAQQTRSQVQENTQNRTGTPQPSNDSLGNDQSPSTRAAADRGASPSNPKTQKSNPSASSTAAEANADASAGRAIRQYLTRKDVPQDVRTNVMENVPSAVAQAQQAAGSPYRLLDRNGEAQQKIAADAIKQIAEGSGTCCCGCGLACCVNFGSKVSKRWRMPELVLMRTFAPEWLAIDLWRSRRDRKSYRCYE